MEIVANPGYKRWREQNDLDGALITHARVTGVPLAFAETRDRTWTSFVKHKEGTGCEWNVIIMESEMGEFYPGVQGPGYSWKFA